MFVEVCLVPNTGTNLTCKLSPIIFTGIPWEDMSLLILPMHSEWLFYNSGKAISEMKVASLVN
jgi:hypothetical protein